MPVTLRNEPFDTTIPMNELADGQLAVIKSFGKPSDGKVVQMLKGNRHYGIKVDVVIVVGSPNGATYSEPVTNNIRVRPLLPGELIEVKNN